MYNHLNLICKLAGVSSVFVTAVLVIAGRTVAFPMACADILPNFQ